MKASSHYLRAQNFSLPSLHNDNNNKLKYKSFHNHDKNFTNDDVLICTNNIMFDSRVCRGNTYATPVLTEDQRRNKSVYERIQKSRRLSLLQKRESEKLKRSRTPSPVHGRVHVTVQTDGTLEEIFGSSHVEILHGNNISDQSKGQQTKFEKTRTIDNLVDKENEIDRIMSQVEDVRVVEVTESKKIDDRFSEKEIEQKIIVNEATKNDTEEVQEAERTNNHHNQQLLTQMIARAIYEEAKNDAISKIDHDHAYHSDPQR